MKRTYGLSLVALATFVVGVSVGSGVAHYLLVGRSDSASVANKVHVAELLFASASKADAVRAQLDLLATTAELRSNATADRWELGVAELEAHLRLATLRKNSEEHVAAAKASCDFAGMKACDRASLLAIRRRLARERREDERP